MPTEEEDAQAGELEIMAHEATMSITQDVMLRTQSLLSCSAAFDSSLTKTGAVIDSVNVDNNTDTPLTLSSCSSASYFAYDKAATSLNDLAIVRKIIEREGCLEALAQLLASHSRATRNTSISSRTSRKDGRRTSSTAAEAAATTASSSSSASTSAMTAAATLAAAPVVVRSLVNQLREVSVQIVEQIARWRRVTGTRVFQWRRVNYLLKMTRDLAFLAAHTATLARLDAFRGLPCPARNPFLAPLHLDHAVLRPGAGSASEILAIVQRLGLQCGASVRGSSGHGNGDGGTVFLGSVDMTRIIAVSHVLLAEEELVSEQPHGQGRGRGREQDREEQHEPAEGTRQVGEMGLGSEREADRGEGWPREGGEAPRDDHETRSRPSSSDSGSGMSMARVHWTHEPLPLQDSRVHAVAPSPARRLPATSEEHIAAMHEDARAARELVFQHEHELGALREELAVLQRRLADALTRKASSDHRRALQTQVAAGKAELSRRTGDVFHRRNELQRLERELRLAERQRQRQYQRQHQRQRHSLSASDGGSELCDPGDLEHACGRSESTAGADTDADGHDGDKVESSGGLPPPDSPAFQAALQQDELRRQELIEKFQQHVQARHTNVRSASSRLGRQQSRRGPPPPPSPLPPASPSPSPLPSSSAAPPRTSSSSSSSSSPLPSPSPVPTSTAPPVFEMLPALPSMSSADVEAFVDSLPLGDGAPAYGARLRRNGIDGALLAQATDRDLLELGVEIRLHRVRILRAIHERVLTVAGASSSQASMNM